MTGNREHDHGQVRTLLGGQSIGWARSHEDGTVYATMERTNQRRPYTFIPTRDGKGLRAVDRGKRRREALDAVTGFVPGLVVEDRRGRDPGHGVDEAEHDRIVAAVQRHLGNREPSGQAFAHAVDMAALDVHRQPSTVRARWRLQASRVELARLVDALGDILDWIDGGGELTESEEHQALLMVDEVARLRRLLGFPLPNAEE